MAPATRIPAASTAMKISHRGRSPERAASLLVGELGRACALVVAGRELFGARKARSRLRFQFWAEVRDRLDRHPRGGGLSEDATRPAAAP